LGIYTVELYLKVRLACSEGMSRRRAAKHFNISRDSVAKMLSYSAPPGYQRRSPIRRPKLDAFVATIDHWLDEDVKVPRKQRHTAKRVFDRLRDECGFTGGYTIIKDYMRERDQRRQEVFVPLAHPPGHAQADFGEAMVVIGGVERKAHFFVLDLSHSDGCYVRAYPAAVSEVEGLVGYARRNFMVPIPQFATWDAFNVWLEEQCHKRQRDRLRGESETIGERLQRDLAAMRPLPASPFDACDQASAKVTAQSLVRYKTNDYSVPVAYGHQDVWVRGYVDEVVIGCRGEIIARHPRSWEREDVVFDPVHYLPLIEQKINALDQAAPLQGWDLPEEFATLRRLMEGRMAKHGRREYVQVLRLLESFELADLLAAVKQALQLGAIGFDAVKHLILCRVERRPPRLDLSIYPYLPRATVETTSAKAYMRLLSAHGEEAA